MLKELFFFLIYKNVEERIGAAGVLADGRCLFRAIAHGACLRSGVEAPDDNRQRELADELRAQVLQLLIIKALSFLWNLKVVKFMTFIVYNLLNGFL